MIPMFRTQYPFVYLNILTQRTTVDVNITPDKRQVILITLFKSITKSLSQNTLNVKNSN